MHFTLCDFWMDLVQNSVEAGANLISLTMAEMPGKLLFQLKDNGCGMTKEELIKVRDPFFTDGIKHSRRKVGLGIPFLQQTLQLTDGELRIESEKGKGTEIEAVFKTDHIDTPPVGDISSFLFQAFVFEGDYDMDVSRSLVKVNGKSDGYELRRNELSEVLGDLSDCGSMLLLRDFIRSQEDELNQGD